MADLYVAAGVKQQEIVARGFEKKMVVNGAKSLGEMHGAELAPTGTPSTNES